MPTPKGSRRRWLVIAAAATGATTLRRVSAAPSARLDDLRVISWKEPLYHGWPTLARRTDCELLLAFSGGREAHVCPFGRVELMRSKDGGASWLWPQVLLDGPIDDRDAGVVETRAGTILVTTFTSLAYEPILMKAAALPAGAANAWEPGHLAEWQAVHGRLTPDGRRAEVGTWMLRSTDGGLTFSARYAVPVNSPHGPATLADGRLLYCGIELWKPERRVGACVSDDDGLSWRWLATIPTRPGDESRQYHELHAIETADGRLVAQIRNHNAANRDETLQTESDDGGRSWSVPHGIGVWGYPSHLLRLADGRLLMTYGHRRPPIGNQARISDDGGRTWSEAIPLTTDATNGDMGYPSTVERTDGTLVTVWYERLASRPEACLRQAIWRLA